MVTTKLNLSMTEPSVRQIYAKQGDTGRVLDISLDQTPEDGTLRILRPDGVEVTSDAVTGVEVESGSAFESLTEADVTELTVGIEPVQDLNGFDKPWVGGAGVNLYDGSLIRFNADPSATSLNGITLTKNADGSFRVRGTASAETRLNVNYTDSFAVASYAISVRGITGSGLRIILQGNPSSAGIAYTSVYPTSDWSQVYSVTESSTLNYFFLDVQSGATIDFTLKVQIEKGSTATAYEPYSNICPITGHDEVTVNFGAEQGAADDTYTTSLGQTVYGGTLDMVTGVLTVDKAEYQLSDMTASLVSGNRWFFTSLQNVIKLPPSTSIATTTISDRFVAMSNVEMANTTNIGLAVNGQGNLVVRNGSSTDQPIGQVVIPLANPVTYQLTAQQIKTLVGTNNVWASSGDIISVKFAYDGLLSELPSEATEIVGKCYCDIEQNGVSSMPFTLNVKKNERQ